MDRSSAAMLLCLILSTAFACSESQEAESPAALDAANAGAEGDAGWPDGGPVLLPPDAFYEMPDAGSLPIPEPQGSSIVWLHTGRTLYKGDLAISPFTFEKVGDFACDGYEATTGATSMSVTDLAVDQDENLYGVTSKAVLPLAVDGTAVRCTAIWPFPEGTASFMGLTFAPKGTLDDQKEVLVGADNSGKLWRIDEATGAVTQIGSFGKVPADDGQGNAYADAYVGEDFKLSGDIAFMSNAGNPVGFATVRECTDYKKCGVDTLVEIDLSKLRDGNTGTAVKSIRGKVVKRADCADTATEGYGSMYGIAAWDAQVYGFSYAGEIVEISNADGTACLLAQGKDESGAVLKFNGAGITTSAKVVIEFN